MLQPPEDVHVACFSSSVFCVMALKIDRGAVPEDCYLATVHVKSLVAGPACIRSSA